MYIYIYISNCCNLFNFKLASVALYLLIRPTKSKPKKFEIKKINLIFGRNTVKVSH